MSQVAIKAIRTGIIEGSIGARIEIRGPFLMEYPSCFYFNIIDAI